MDLTRAYYNEFDPGKAEWLRVLIRRGLIAPGDVDERSIADVQPGDLRGYIQCHWFAGIGVWSYALRLAGWPDDRPVWTASCPCQPFSAAGKRKGKADERHLWPELARLLRGSRPVICFGEQVASSDGLAWIDDVFDDLEGEGYNTAGAADSCAAGYGAGHERQRLYWVAHAPGQRLPVGDREPGGEPTQEQQPQRLRVAGGLADAERESIRDCGRAEVDGAAGAVQGDGGERQRLRADVIGSGVAGGLADAASAGLEGWQSRRRDDGEQRAATERTGATERLGDSESRGRGERGNAALAANCGHPDGAIQTRGPVNGFWQGAYWVLTRPQRVGDSPRLRPIEPPSQPLADGTTGGVVRGRYRGFPLAQGEEARVLRLKGYGDAIVAPQAAWWISSVMEELGWL